MARAWLNPRSRCLERWSGTGTTSISEGASGEKLHDGRGKNGPETPRRGAHAFVLQRMNRCTQAAIISAERDGSCELRWSEPAGTAKLRGFDAFHNRRIEGVAAAPADGAGVSRNLSPAGIANWNGRELRQRGAAKSTGMREGGWIRVRQRLKPEDFGGRALLRANGMSPIVNRRSSSEPEFLRKTHLT